MTQYCVYYIRQRIAAQGHNGLREATCLMIVLYPSEHIACKKNPSVKNTITMPNLVSNTAEQQRTCGVSAGREQ